MRVDPKALVDRLNPTSTRMLEAAVARAASGQYYEITSEHMLLKVLEPEDGDAARILQAFEQPRLALLARVQRVLEGIRTGNAGRPVFSERLFTWFEDAWVLASLHHGAVRLRSGHLLLAFIARGARYSGESYPELDAIPVAELRARLDELLFDAPESEPRGDDGTPAGPRASAGEEALPRFTFSFTAAARQGEIDPIFGRHREIRQLIDILARRRKNNPIIVGEPGVGKTALVEGLARSIVREEVPEQLRGVDLLSLDLGLLQAGASVKGEFEKRLKAVIEEVKSSPRKIVLFIDEAHTMIGAGGGAGGSDASNLLKPALARGELRTIAATTWSEYKKYFEKDPALARRFQPVKVDEPSEDDAVVMLRGIRATYERAHGVTIRDDAVVAAVRLSHRYISGRQLPDKAVDLLDTAAARVKIERAAKPGALISLEERAAATRRELDAVLRDREQGVEVDGERLEALRERLGGIEAETRALSDRWSREREAAALLTEATRRGPGDGESAGEAGEGTREGESAGAGEDAARRVQEARAGYRAAVGDGSPIVHAEVDEDVVAQVVASWTGIPVGKMRTSTIDAALRLEEVLEARVKGQRGAIQIVAETVRMAYAGVRDPRTPIGVLLFVGPSGVGKTETALALADQLYGGERFLTTINMSEFQEKHTVSRLVGSPPGYVGYGEGGVLTEAVRQRPYSVVLLDEVEKADLDVMNLFYQVFDKGVLNDGEGREVDFKNTVVILTSNLASAEISRLYNELAEADDEGEGDEGDEDGEERERSEADARGRVVEAVRPLLSAHFKPALLGRMTVIPFRPLPRDILRDITVLKLSALARRIEAAHGLQVETTPALVDALVQRTDDPDSGARAVDHVLRGSLMPALARALLERLADGELAGRVRLDLDPLDPSGGWRFEFEDDEAAS